MGWSRDTIRRVAKRTGYPVVEAWSRHNKGTMGTIYGPMLHHTATPSYVSGDYPTLRIVRDGRPGLENSLCMFGIGRSGKIYLINDKVSWHAGSGYWRGTSDGNGHFAGIEAEGPYNTWPAAELDSYEKLVASVLLETRRGIEWAPTHAQWAPGRKSDPYGFDLNRFRSNVQKHLNNPASLGAAREEDELNATEKKQLAEVHKELAEVHKWLQYGIPGVRRHGEVYRLANSAADGVADLKAQVAAQQTAINKLIAAVAALRK